MRRQLREYGCGQFEGTVSFPDSEFVHYGSPRIQGMMTRFSRLTPRCNPPEDNKVCEELIAYFPLIRHGPQRK
jgi:hypothetical protein